MRRRLLAVSVTAGVLLTAACGAAGGSAPPTWEPSPGGLPSEGPGVRISPIVPLPTGASGASGSTAPGKRGSAGASPTPSPSKSGTGDPAVVATHLSAPVGLAMLPDGTALVGERTTGRILQVQPVAGRPTPVVKRLTGLDTAGGGGLLDLAVSPEYSQDQLVYAYISTARDNRVVEFTLNGPVTPVLTGIPHGSRDNAGRITFDAAGNLLIGTGTAGIASPGPRRLAGKVLRVNSIGQPVAGNSPIYSSGHDGVSGLCPVPKTTVVLDVEPGSPRAVIHALRSGAVGAPVATLPASTPDPGDCAVQAGRLWVTSPDGQALLDAPLGSSGTAVRVGTWGQVLTRKYGRLLTVVAAADGALWLTTTNRDGHGKPIAADERVIRYTPSASGGGAGSQF